MKQINTMLVLMVFVMDKRRIGGKKMEFRHYNQTDNRMTAIYPLHFKKMEFMGPFSQWLSNKLK